MARKIGKKRKKLLYKMDGKRVPLSYIKAVYEGRPYIPPITPDLTKKLYLAVYHEWLLGKIELLTISTG